MEVPQTAMKPSKETKQCISVTSDGFSVTFTITNATMDVTAICYKTGQMYRTTERGNYQPEELVPFIQKRWVTVTRGGERIIYAKIPFFGPIALSLVEQQETAVQIQKLQVQNQRLEEQVVELRALLQSQESRVMSLESGINLFTIATCDNPMLTLGVFFDGRENEVIKGWQTFKFKKEVEFNVIRLIWYDDNEGSEAEYSHDGNKWINFLRPENKYGNKDISKICELPIRARYVRFTGYPRLITFGHRNFTLKFCGLWLRF